MSLYYPVSLVKLYAYSKRMMEVSGARGLALLGNTQDGYAHDASGGTITVRHFISTSLGQGYIWKLKNLYYMNTRALGRPIDFIVGWTPLGGGEQVALRHAFRTLNTVTADHFLADEIIALSLVPHIESGGEIEITIHGYNEGAGFVTTLFFLAEYWDK